MSNQFPGGSESKECLQCRKRGFDPWVGKIDPLEKGMAIHYSSIPAQRIPWKEEPGGIQSYE